MDREEFVSRVNQNRPKLLFIASRMLRSADCEDALQSAILSAWEHLGQLRDERAFDAWLAKILINRCRQVQRGYQKDREILDNLKQNAGMAAEESGLLDAIEELSEEERRLLCLHYHQGYTIREIADMKGQSEDGMKMRLYRARKHLRIILISLLLLILFACAAIGTGLIDVNWFLQNRRAEPASICNSMTPERIEIDYAGNLIDVEISDAVWNLDDLSVTLVYSVAGKGNEALTVHSGNIGVDGMRFDHIWTSDGIVPVLEWADGKHVHMFSVDGWRLSGLHLMGAQDYLPDGLGETFMAQLYLDWIEPDRYESLLDANGMLAFEAELTLEDYESGETLEAQKAVVRIGAPTAQEWRKLYEAYHR